MSRPFPRKNAISFWTQFLAAALLSSASHAQQLVGPTVQFCGGASHCAGKNSKLTNFTMLQQGGARPRWSPNGQTIVFDKQNADKYSDVYLMDYFGNITAGLTKDNPGITQKNNGNAIFDHSGNYVIFVSEAPDHVEIPAVLGASDPGIGLFSNLWATDILGSRFFQLTNVPVATSLTDPTPYYAVVNPNLSLDGTQLVYSFRYGPGGPEQFGMWRLMSAPFSTAAGVAGIGASSVLFQPSKGNYVTSMGFLDSTHLVVAGNLNGQSEYGMDQYVLDAQTDAVEDLTDTPTIWEEGSCSSPNKQWIVYMSNATSKFQLDFQNPDWIHQPVQREYWLMDRNGNNKEQLTYLNDPSAPEYLGGNNVIVAACDWSPDGRSIVGTLGIEFPAVSGSVTQLKIMRMDFSDSSLFQATGAPILNSGFPVVNGASFTASFASGEWTSIFGENLAASPRSWAASDFVGSALPTELDGVSVEINGKPAYIAYVSPTQLNVLAPDDPTPGPVTVTVKSAFGTSHSVLVDKKQFVPAFFTFQPQGSKYIAATHADNSLIGNPDLFPGLSTPAKPGETIVMYGTGFGPTNPAVPTGQLVGSAVLLANQVTVLIGNLPCDVTFAGLTEAGLDQINVVLPPNLPNGDQPVVANVGGVQTQANAFLTIQR
jgi:uncharacterized protein (TIGR03437 family)